MHDSLPCILISYSYWLLHVVQDISCIDDVAPRANLHRFLCAQTCPRRPLIRVIIRQATMASQNDDVLGLSGDNGAGNVDACMQRESMTSGQETVQHSLHAASQLQTGTSANTNTMEISISPPC